MGMAEFPFVVARALLESRVRNILLLCLWLGVAAWASGAETLRLTEGGALAGDIVKFDDNGLFLRLGGEAYTNVSWGRFSQATLKQLAQNPKIRPFVDVFIEPTAAQRPAAAEIKINPVARLERPAEPALFGGLVKSPVGLVVLLVLYLANLFAAYEISIVRGRPVLQVVGLAAVLPVIGPIIFLALPIPKEPVPAAMVETELDGGEPVAPPEAINLVDASWQHEEKPAETQVFTRGKFTFNKRFLETKFADYIGTLKGDALKFAMTVKTPQAELAAERIAQVGATEVILETPHGQVAVLFTDIQELKLNPINA